MKNFTKWSVTTVVTLALGALFFIGGLAVVRGNETFVARSYVLALAKDDKTSRNLDVILGNLASIPSNVGFYERMLKANGDLDDEWEGLSLIRKKRLWNEKISVAVVENTSLIQISSTGSSMWDEQLLNGAIARELISTASRYYDARREMELRIVGDQEVQERTSATPLWLGALGIFVGLFAGRRAAQVWGRRVLAQAEKNTQEKKAYIPAMSRELADKKVDYSGRPEKLSTTGYQKSEAAKKEKSKKEESPAAAPEGNKRTSSFLTPKVFPTSKTGSAPVNLPTGNFEAVSTFRISPYGVTGQDEKSEHGKKETPEPSEDEVKRRLNALIRGEL